MITRKYNVDFDSGQLHLAAATQLHPALQGCLAACARCQPHTLSTAHTVTLYNNSTAVYTATTDVTATTTNNTAATAVAAANGRSNIATTDGTTTTATNTNAEPVPADEYTVTIRRC